MQQCILFFQTTLFVREQDLPACRLLVEFGSLSASGCIPGVDTAIPLPKALAKLLRKPGFPFPYSQG